MSIFIADYCVPGRAWNSRSPASTIDLPDVNCLFHVFTAASESVLFLSSDQQSGIHCLTICEIQLFDSEHFMQNVKTQIHSTFQIVSALGVFTLSRSTNRPFTFLQKHNIYSGLAITTYRRLGVGLSRCRSTSASVSRTSWRFRSTDIRWSIIVSLPAGPPSESDRHDKMTSFSAVRRLMIGLGYFCTGLPLLWFSFRDFTSATSSSSRYGQTSTSWRLLTRKFSTKSTHYILAYIRMELLPEIFFHFISVFISWPTPRILSFALCLDGTYNTIHSRHSTDTPHTVWSAIDRTVDWARPRRKSIAIDACQKHAHDICRENSK